jgi:CheY-like chemotaxis protein
MTKRILVVEDRDDSRTILVTMLQRLCGYATIEAANGKEAIEKAVSEKPDLILMDLDLPDRWISISRTFRASMRRRL